MEKCKISWKHVLTGLAIIVFAFVADQLSKLYIIQAYPDTGKNFVTIIEHFLYISHVRNTGAAWGILAGNSLILVWGTGIVLFGMLCFLFFTNRMALTIPVAMIVGGGLGNLYDRIFREGVVDFIDVYLWSYDYPVFNVADSILVCGVIALAVYVIFFYKEDNPGYRSLKPWKK